jgi:exodeoxyribonuclease V alpha subunit
MGCIRSYSRWPLLYTAVNKGMLAFVDYAFAEMLLRDYPQADERTAAFLCHLACSARLGHLCLKIEYEAINPSPEELWFFDSQEILSEELKSLMRELNQGIKTLPETIIGCVSVDSLPITPICYFENFIYLQKNWLYESYFLKHLQRLLSTAPAVMPDLNRVNEIIKQMKDKNLITPPQTQAILHSIENALMIICGGPGSGKTYTAAQFIKVLWESLCSKQKEKYEIAVVAPTGKAASNLYNSLRKAVQGMALLELIQPKTLHSLLAVMKKNCLSFLSADLILIDEASMIDAKLMANLLSSVKDGARLIFLGDQYQLPAVEAGSLFADMISLFKETENLNKHRVELTTCYRTEIQDIVMVAEMVKKGDSKQALKLFEKKSNNQYVNRIVFEKANNYKTRELLIEYTWPLFPNPLFGVMDPHHILENFNRFRILSPLRKGMFGVEELNFLLFQKAYTVAKQNELVAIPIVISSNDYQLNLFNGEGGLLIQRKIPHREYLQEGDYALFPEGNNFRKIPAILLPKFEYAYCLSVHKSQGSEFERVLLLLPEGAKMLGREMLYTGITRAKKIIEVWSTDETLIETMKRKTQRYSAIPSRIAGHCWEHLNIHS